MMAPSSPENTKERRWHVTSSRSCRNPKSSIPRARPSEPDSTVWDSPVSLSVRGKRFELEHDGEPTPEVLEQVKKAAETLLANTIIEDVVGVYPAEDGTK